MVRNVIGLLIAVVGVLFVLVALSLLATNRNPKLAGKPVGGLQAPGFFHPPSPIPTNNYVAYQSLNLADIFTVREHRKLNSEDVWLVATGDVIPARVTDAVIRKRGSDYPFAMVKNSLMSGDLSVVNLESPLIDNCPLALETMKFCGQSSFAEAMKRNGVSVATLENNHIGNYGIEAISHTANVLHEAGIETSQLHDPLIKKVKDTTFGIVAVNAVVGGAMVNREVLAQEIAEVKSKTDIVIVCIHWGKEYTHDPSNAPGIAPDKPIELGHFMIDSGADVIIGNHPHWVQGVEKYKNGFITYAHGNFIFDQEWSRETKEGVIGNYIFSQKKLVDVWFNPILIENSAQPHALEGAPGEKILDDMRNSTAKLNSY